MADNLSTSQIEQRYNLSDRLFAVKTFVHACDYLHKEYGWSIGHINACEILMDGIKNALDGRATGDEWRNVRHGYNSERDGPEPPEGRDRRCQDCGAINPIPFTHCFRHLSLEQHSR